MLNRATSILQRESVLAYPGIGSTRTGDSPIGFKRTDHTVVVGHGYEAYRQLAEGILGWELQRRSGLKVTASSPRATPGVRVVNGFGVGPLRVNAPCEVIWTREPVPGSVPQRAGFGYGALKGHPVTGEEAFEVELTDTGEVRLVITAFSKPANWFYRAGSLATGIAQRYVTARYIASARELIS